MKHASTIAGVLLGLVFLLAASAFFFEFSLPVPEGPPPTDDQKEFMGALASTGYMKFVKVFEVIGGILVLIPATRALGLLVLGPIIVNIVAYTAMLGTPSGLLQPQPLAVIVLSLILLLCERRGFARLVTR